LEAANAPVNDNDKRLFFTAQMNSNPLLSQAVEKYLDSAAMPAAGGGIPPPPSFLAMTTYLVTFISIRPPQDQIKAGEFVGSAFSQSAELASLREEIKQLKQQASRAGGGGRSSGRGRFDKNSAGRGSATKQAGRGDGSRASIASQRDRPKNSRYCFVHGFGQHNTNECSLALTNPKDFIKPMFDATGPHSVPGHTGSTKRQIE
jgi:hypothetical protein